MNLPTNPEEGEFERQLKQQDERYTVKTVKSLLDRGYSPKEIVKLSEVESLNLDRNEVMEAMAYQDAGKIATKNIIDKTYNGLKLAGQILFFPWSVHKNSFLPGGDNFSKTIVALGASYMSHIFISFEVGGGGEIEHPYYFGAAIGLNIINGFYEWHGREKNKTIKENLSKLEQIANGSETESE